MEINQLDVSLNITRTSTKYIKKEEIKEEKIKESLFCKQLHSGYLFKAMNNWQTSYAGVMVRQAEVVLIAEVYRCCRRSPLKQSG